MSRSLKSFVFAAACAGVMFAAAPGFAGPLSVAVPQEAGASSFVEQAKHYNPPPAKKCIKWTRRWNTAHGFGHRRCVHWK